MFTGPNRIVGLTLAVLAGCIVAPFLPVSVWAWLAAAGLALLAVIVTRGGRVALAALGLALGGARTAWAQPGVPTADQVAYHIDSTPVTLTGRVLAEPDAKGDRTRLRVWVETLTTPEGAERRVSGWVQVTAQPLSPERLAVLNAGAWAYGDSVVITGTLQSPPRFADFDYRAFLERQGVLAVVQPAEVVWLASGAGLGWARTALEVKQAARQRLATLFPEPHAALLQGVLLGDDNGIPPELAHSFRTTGITHILAISGFNIAVIAGLLLALVRRVLKPGPAAVVVALLLGAYAWLVGGSASVVRSTLTAVLGLTAERLGRRNDGFRGLAVASLAMAVWDPAVVWDVGYQLSAGATVGLILYTEPFQKHGTAALARIMPAAWAERVAGVVGEGIFGSLAAQLTTLPLILFYFQNLSLASLPANAFILPAQPAVMVVGGASLLVSLIWQPAGQAVAWLAWPFTAYTIGLSNLFAQLPLALISVDMPGIAGLVVYYVGLGALTWWTRQPVEARPTWLPGLGQPASWVALVGAGALGLWGWSAFWRAPQPGTTRVTILALGTGLASLIETTDGARILIDAGPPGLASARALDARLPPFDRHLHGLLLTAGEEERIGGLVDLVGRYHIAAAWAPPEAQAADPWLEARPALAEAGARLADDAGSITLAQTATLTMAPQGPVFDWRQARIQWVTSEIDAAHTGAAHVLVVAATLEPLALADAILSANPSAVIVLSSPVSPPPELEAALSGRVFLPLELRGAVTLTTDGERLWIETERESISSGPP